jgi:hypothetical protein
MGWTKAELRDNKMNHISIMFRVAKRLRWFSFLAGSVAVFAQNPVAPQGGEFSILGNVPGDQVWPSLFLSPSAGVIAW